MRTKPLKIKVCGMKYAANIAEVADLHPDYLGFIFYEKSPRYISEISSELVKYVPKEIKTVGVFVDEILTVVKQKVANLNLIAVQLHGRESVEFCNDLKADYPNLEIIKAFGIDDAFDFSKLNAYASVVDFFLFDTKTASHGGSGKQFDWEILSKYNLPIPYFLSGGIDIEQIKDIKAVSDNRLVAVDINSKFEAEPGLKNVIKLKLFIEAMNSETT